MSHGSRTPEISGLGLVNRSGLIRRQSEWKKNNLYLWKGFCHTVFFSCFLPYCRLKLKAVYMFAAGFYTYSIFALLFWETRRSDFGVSMSHHLATVVLIVLSYIFRYILNNFPDKVIVCMAFQLHKLYLNIIVFFEQICSRWLSCSSPSWC